jgi:hypothetical protein
MDVTVDGMVAVPTQVPPAETTLLVIVNVPCVHDTVCADAGDASAATTKAATAATEQATTTVRGFLDIRIPDAPTVDDGAGAPHSGPQGIWIE